MNVWDDLMQNFKKDGSREWHNGKIISSIIVVVALIIFLFYKNRALEGASAERKANLTYTVGITGKKYHNIKSSQPIIEYFYIVGGHKYSDIEHISAEYENSVIASGQRYYVEFSSKDPSNSKLLLNYPVPDSVVIPDEELWPYMPGYTKKH
jgi:hypothetical protein